MPTVKQILVAYKVDVSDWKSALSGVMALYDGLNNKVTALAEDSKSHQQAIIEGLTSQAEAAKSVSEEYQQHNTLLQDLQTALQPLLELTAQRLESERQITQELSQQTEHVRQQSAAGSDWRKQGGGGRQESEEGGFFGALGSTVIGGAGALQWGRQFTGQLALGVAAGELFGEMLNKVIGKMEELFTEGGKVSTLTATFERLGAVKGVDTEKFLDGLRVATHGLVGDTELLKLANTTLSSPLKLTTDQVVTLTRNVVALGRAHSHDATEGVASLTRALESGYPRLLSHIIGVSRLELQTRGLGAAMSPIQREQAAINQIMEVAAARFQLVGDPVLTVTERMTQLQQAASGLFDRLSVDLHKTEGFQEFLTLLGNVGEEIGKEGGLVDKFAKGMAEAFAAISFATKSFKQDITDLISEIGKLFNTTNADVPGIGTVWQRTLVVTYAAMEGLLGGLKNFVALIDYLKSTTSLKDPLGFLPLGQTKAESSFLTEFKKQLDLNESSWAANVSNFIAAIQSAGEKGASLTGAGGSGGSTDTGSVAAERQRAAEKLKREEADAKKEFEIVKQGIEDRKLALEESYSDDEISLAEYTQRKIALIKEETTAEVQNQDQLAVLKKKGIDNRVKEGQLDAKAAVDAKKAIDDEIFVTELHDQEAANKEIAALNKKEQGDESAQKLEAIKSLGKAKIEILKQQAEEEKKFFVTSTESSQDYLQIRLQNLNDELAAYGTMIEQEIQEAGANEKKKQELLDQLKAYTIKTLGEIFAAQDEVRTEEIAKEKKQYQDQITLLEAVAKTGQLQGTGGVGTVIAAKTAEFSLTEERITQLLPQIQQLSAEFGSTSPQVLELVDSLGKAQEKLAELRGQTESWYTALGTGLTSLGQALSGFGGHTLQGISKGLQEGGQVFDALQKYQEQTDKYNEQIKAQDTANINKEAADIQLEAAQLNKQSAAQKSPSSGQFPYGTPDVGTGTGALGPSGNPLQDIVGSLKSLISGDAKAFSQAVDNLTAIAANIRGLSEALSGQGGPAAAGLAGLSSGGALGGEIGKGLKSLFSGISSAAGPIGAVVGAGVGLFTGIFEGKAQQAAQDIEVTITTAVQKIQTQLSEGLQTLQLTITQLQAQETQAIDSLSGSKQGRKILDQLLPQLQNQIAQLKAQQAQVIKSFDESVEELSAPSTYQQYISSMKSIIDTWQQYIDAGGNVILANQYLTESFANLRVGYLQTFEQDQESAIQNALNYNNLLLQRQQLISSTQDQIDQLLGQNAPQQQRTQAQQKLAEIAQLESSRDLQLEQLNEQIQVSGYQLSIQQQIFSLATTRIGLEQQLAEVQMAVIYADEGRIQALQAVLALLAGNTGNLTSLAGLLQALGYSVPPGSIPPTPAGQPAGNPANPNVVVSSPAMTRYAGGGATQMFKGMYNTRGRQGIGGFNGER